MVNKLPDFVLAFFWFCAMFILTGILTDVSFSFIPYGNKDEEFENIFLQAILNIFQKLEQTIGCDIRELCFSVVEQCIWAVFKILINFHIRFNRRSIE